ncbi:hypothetical protein GF377_03315 [candidate division GN15 bacterium]|nr:hypothetical protein [candidate division GN15 bacterium]
MGADFVGRSLKTSAVVLLVFFPFLLYYFGLYPAVAVLSGGVWSILNLVFISILVRSVIRPGGAQQVWPVAVSAAGMAGLFVAGYFLLTVEVFEAWQLLIGFTSLFAVMFLKALGRAFLRLDEESSARQEAEKVI